jgi:hypothetical protein
MVSFLAGICELCGEPKPLATPEQCKVAGFDVEASACVDCLKRMNPAAGDTISISPPGEWSSRDADVVTWEPLVPRKPGSN